MGHVLYHFHSLIIILNQLLHWCNLRFDGKIQRMKLGENKFLLQTLWSYFFLTVLARSCTWRCCRTWWRTSIWSSPFTTSQKASPSEMLARLRKDSFLGENSILRWFLNGENGFSRLFLDLILVCITLQWFLAFCS